jgi:hypothetical protein
VRRVFLTLLACSLLGTGAAGCGNSNGNTSSRSGSTTSGSRSTADAGTSTVSKLDRDGDHDNNDDDSYVLGFGHVADAADNREITTLIRRYFAAAATNNGRQACSILTPFVAEVVVEQYGHTPALRGGSCAQVMSKLFAHEHRELVGKHDNLRVIRVGVEGDVARVGLEFPEIHTIRQIRMRRQGNRWTVLDVLDHLIE